MMFGLGTDTASGTTTGTGTTPAATPIPSFSDGLKLWTTPGNAVTVLTATAKNPSVAFGSTIMPFTLGLLAVPLAAVALVMSMSGSKRGGM